MILVLTINLAIDKVATVEKFQKGKENRIRIVSSLPGGKGANVSRALRCLKEEVCLCGFIGGKNGEFIEEGLKREGIFPLLFPIEEENRVCLIVKESTGKVTEIYEIGPQVEEEIQEEFYSYFRGLWADFSWVVISGSLPPGFPDDYYAKLLKGRKGKRVFFDFYSLPLLKALEEGAFLLKINEREFRRTFGGSDFLGKLKSLPHKFPIQHAVVTLGERGAIGTDGKRCFRVIPSYKAEVLCPVGAGDAFMGGLVHAFREGWDFKEAMIFGTATSVSNLGFWEGGRVDPLEVSKIIEGKALKIEEL
ncbi:MAG: 1-phosphofructokinase family hexose kinase [Caldiserica bacterium]|jgi:tagatose 6-phosphate kinase|nr:1-phosphofructokinase family hexose kinase [Caldisericota bacterium]MDH7562411.1 1-phosphofructokinase family hexose kinase [Caldisericota bacterium]